MSFFKTLINVGMNTSNDQKVPVFVTEKINKEKNFEIRVYEKNKYVVIKYKILEKVILDESAKKEKVKKANEKIMNSIWKMMKYTQGENDQKKSITFCMPVFIHLETLWKNEENRELEAGDIEEELEIKLMLSLPPEYQPDSKNPSKLVLEPPVPNDESIHFETLDDFRCYVREFSGFSGDDEYKAEAKKLKISLTEEKLEKNEKKIICISYDPPYKLFGRRNEIIVPVS